MLKFHSEPNARNDEAEVKLGETYPFEVCQTGNQCVFVGAANQWENFDAYFTFMREQRTFFNSWSEARNYIEQNYEDIAYVYILCGEGSRREVDERTRELKVKFSGLPVFVFFEAFKSQIFTNQHGAVFVGAQTSKKNSILLDSSANRNSDQFASGWWILPFAALGIAIWIYLLKTLV